MDNDNNDNSSILVGQPGVAMVGNLAGQQVLSQPGVATPTVYNLGTGQPAQHQFSVQQAGVASLQVSVLHVWILLNTYFLNHMLF